ncbi:MAG: HEAT repeat domain-containing protein, partial [Polyangiaceae bacterium]
MKRAKRISIFALMACGILGPSALVVGRAFADEDDQEEAPQAGEKMNADEVSKKRRAVLLAMATNDAVLINVTGREMPASPDVLNLGRKSARALARCVADNVDDKLRADCASMLGRLGDKAGLAALQGALEAWNPEVRAQAIEALHKMPDRSSILPLRKFLDRKDEEPANLALALQALGSLSDTGSLPILHAHFRESDDNDPQVRIAAFWGLWKSRHIMARATIVADVASALTSGDKELELAGTFAASELRAPQLVAPLIKLMDDADTRLRNRAVYALGKIGDRAAISALLAALPKVRESRMLNNIAFALERLDPASFYRVAPTLIGHKQAQIRMNAAFVIGDVKRPEGLPLLKGALEDKNDAVRISAVTAVGKLDAPDGAKLLERFVDDPNPSLQRAAIYAVYALSGMKRTSLVYDKLYLGPRPGDKLEAALALGKANDPRVVPDLLNCLELRTCSEESVDAPLRASTLKEVPGRTLLAWAQGRVDVTDLVAYLKPEGGAPLSVSAVSAELAHKNVGRTANALDLSGDLNDEKALLVLKPLLGHENTRVRMHAEVALARHGDTSADPIIFSDFDNLPHDLLPSFVRLMGRVSEAPARARLTPELVKREKGTDPNIAVAAAAIRLAWEPEQGIFRMLEALGSPLRLDRDLADHYLRVAREP